MAATTQVERPLPRTDAAARRLTFSRTLRFEWIKFRSLRSNWITLAAVFAVIAGFGLLAGAMSGREDGTAPGGPGGPGGSGSPIETVLVGANLALLIVGVLGALLGAREYSSGMIRGTLTAVPRRVTVLSAKALVVVMTLVPVIAAALLVAFFGGMQVLSAAGQPTVSVSDDGVLRVLVGTGAYLVGIAVGGLALGVLLRSIAGSIAVLIGGVLFVPTLAGALLPDSWDAVLKYLPSNAGASFTSITPPDGMLAALPGALVLAAWVGAGLLGAAVALRRRDA